MSDGSTPSRGWSRSRGAPTTLALLRHGETAYTRDKRFSGGLGGSNPGLSEVGESQMRAAADWLSSSSFDAVIASPVRRTVESAAIVASALGLDPREEPGFAEMEFGDWDGLTFAEVHDRDPQALSAWARSTDAVPGGTGESFAVVRDRVLGGLDRLLDEHAGQTLLIVSHVTPIKILVAEAMGAPLEAVFRTELSPASLSVVAFHPGEGRRGSLRLFNATPGAPAV